MIINIPEDSLNNCKELIQEFQKSQSGFKELGGYLIGSYDGNFSIQEFILDKNADATGTRIKLSAECFHQVEQKLAQNNALMYVGTWHVHPGKSKPTFSHTDESTLFLEKLVIKTDNPKEFQCPRIHLIFSQDLKLISAFSMVIDLEYTQLDYWTNERTLDDEKFTQIDTLVQNLQDVKNELMKYRKNQDLNILDHAFTELGEIRETLDEVLDNIEEVSEYQEIFKIIQKEQKIIEKQLKHKIEEGSTLGLIILTEEEKITLIDYLPNNIAKHQEEDTLIGFWRHFSIQDPPAELQEIFLANFFLKVQENPRISYIYISSDPKGFKYNDLNLLEFMGISFEEIEIVLEE